MNSLTSTSPWILIPLLHKEIANMLSMVHVVIKFTKTQAGWSWGCSQELVVVDGARHPLPPRALRVLCSVRDLCRHAVGTHHRPRNSTHRKVQISPLPHRHCRRWFGDQVCSWNHSGSRKEVRKKKIHCNNKHGLWETRSASYFAKSNEIMKTWGSLWKYYY